MRIATDNDRTTATLDGYGDLLRVRALPNYRFLSQAPPVVEIDAADLDLLGVATDEYRPELHLATHLFDFQDWIVRRAVDRERFAVFALTGLGKTAIQLEWARLVTERHQGRTLIVAPLSVCGQTVAEAERFYGDRFPVANLTATADLEAWLADGTGCGITNYEKLDRLAPQTESVDSLKYSQGDQLSVQAVVLDESSMLKGFGPRKFSVIRAFDGVRYKLACSATPAPNQRTEFAQHALFLGLVRSTTEYLTAYFVNRDGDWEFKPHAFDAWVTNLAAWSVFMHEPASWGFADHNADLPPKAELFPQVTITDEQRERAHDFDRGDQPSLFGATPGGVTSRTKMMQIAHGFILDSGRVVDTFPADKPAFVADLANDKHADEQVIIWVTFDHEGDQLADLIPGSMHLSGKLRRSVRDETMDRFRAGDPTAPRVLLLKPSMFGFGVNLQSCATQIFSSITDSFERFFQCVRRSYRYGQTRPVTVYVPVTTLDEAILQNVMNKQSVFAEDARRLEAAVIARLRPQDTSEVIVVNTEPEPELDRTEADRWTMIHGDAIAHLPAMEPASADLCVFSPPFAALYAYSKALGDMGNVRSDTEFRLQWRWFADRLLPVMRPGRIVAVHAKEIIRFANTHGYRHCYDFPSDLRDGLVDAGFRYHRRITIWKNPQLEATRNKETSLLHVTAARDAADSFPQTGEYLMVFTAPGDNPAPIHKPKDQYSFEVHTEWMNSIWPEPEEPADGEAAMWRQLIHPDGNGSVWDGIRETDVLTARTAKESPDEKHVCPLQLGLIDRVVNLWSNPGDLVLSPFAGIGSEGWSALGAGRRFYGVELKESYYRTACANLVKRSEMATTPALF